jgi:fucose 4-O-acetylase-like acetyltransferase
LPSEIACLFDMKLQEIVYGSSFKNILNLVPIWHRIWSPLGILVLIGWIVKTSPSKTFRPFALLELDCKTKWLPLGHNTFWFGWNILHIWKVYWLFIFHLFIHHYDFLCPCDEESWGILIYPCSSILPFVRPDIDTWFVRLSPPTVLELQL